MVSIQDKPKRFANLRSERGFNLMDVTIAILIFSITVFLMFSLLRGDQGASAYATREYQSCRTVAMNVLETVKSYGNNISALPHIPNSYREFPLQTYNSLAATGERYIEGDLTPAHRWGASLPIVDPGPNPRVANHQLLIGQLNFLSTLYHRADVDFCNEYQTTPITVDLNFGSPHIANVRAEMRIQPVDLRNQQIIPGCPRPLYARPLSMANPTNPFVNVPPMPAGNLAFRATSQDYIGFKVSSRVSFLDESVDPARPMECEVEQSFQHRSESPLTDPTTILTDLNPLLEQRSCTDWNRTDPPENTDLVDELVFEVQVQKFGSILLCEDLSSYTPRQYANPVVSSGSQTCNRSLGCVGLDPVFTDPAPRTRVGGRWVACDRLIENSSAVDGLRACLQNPVTGFQTEYDPATRVYKMTFRGVKAGCHMIVDVAEVDAALNLASSETPDSITRIEKRVKYYDMDEVYCLATARSFLYCPPSSPNDIPCEDCYGANSCRCNPNQCKCGWEDCSCPDYAAANPTECPSAPEPVPIGIEPTVGCNDVVTDEYCACFESGGSWEIRCLPCAESGGSCDSVCSDPINGIMCLPPEP